MDEWSVSIYRNDTPGESRGREGIVPHAAPEGDCDLAIAQVGGALFI